MPRNRGACRSRTVVRRPKLSDRDKRVKALEEAAFAVLLRQCAPKSRHNDLPGATWPEGCAPRGLLTKEAHDE